MMKTKFIRFVLAMLIPASLAACSGKSDAKEAEQEKKNKQSFMFWMFRKEIRTAEFSVPEMRDQNAVRKIEKRLALLPGIVSVTSDTAARRLSIGYASSVIRRMNLEEAIARAGFRVDNRPPAPAAKRR